MKTYVQFIEDSYHLFADDQDLGQCIPMKDPKDKTGIAYKLPSNPANRTWIKGAIICDGFEVKPKVDKVMTGERKSGKKLLDYLTEEERKIYDDLIAKATERKEADKKKPLTELQKAQKLLEKWQAKVTELQGGIK